MSDIEFCEVPEQTEILLEFGSTRKTRRYRCDISHGNVISEVYNETGEIVATCIRDLVKMGVTKATVIAHHEVDTSYWF